MNKYTCKVVLTDKGTGEEVVYDLRDRFYINQQKDLEEVPLLSGDSQARPVVLRATNFTLTARIPNPNYREDLEEALNKAAKRVKEFGR